MSIPRIAYVRILRMDLIPLIDAPRQTLTIVLGGQSLHLEVWWQPLSSKLVSVRR